MLRNSVRRLGEVLARIDLLLGEVLAGIDLRQTSTVFAIVALFAVFLLVRVGGNEAIETDDGATARRPAFSPLLSARISTVVRSISAEAIWLAIPRFQTRS